MPCLRKISIISKNNLVLPGTFDRMGGKFSALWHRCVVTANKWYLAFFFFLPYICFVFLKPRWPHIGRELLLLSWGLPGNFFLPQPWPCLSLIFWNCQCRDPIAGAGNEGRKDQRSCCTMCTDPSGVLVISVCLSPTCWYSYSNLLKELFVGSPGKPAWWF